jgi:hypothetical protein
MVLTASEIKQLTGALKYSKQRQELEHMRIRYRTRMDGSLVVLLSDVLAVGKTVDREPQLCE